MQLSLSFRNRIMGKRLSSRQIAIASGETTYHGRTCPRCLHTRRLVKNYECLHCMELEADEDGVGKTHTQILRLSPSYKVRKAEYDRQYHLQRKLKGTPFGIYIASFNCVEETPIVALGVGTPTNARRASARKGGRKTYSVGTECSQCLTDKRYVINNECVECARLRSLERSRTDAGRAANRNRQARFQERRRKQQIHKCTRI